MSLKIFAVINSLIGLISGIEYYFFWTELPFTVAFEVTKSIIGATLMDTLSNHKPRIQQREQQQQWTLDLVLHTVCTDMVKALVIASVMSTPSMLFELSTYSVAVSTLSFVAMIPIKAFMFEILFDFGHYWVHRCYHSQPILYQYVHKKHHQYAAPSAYTTFYHSPIDIAISFGLPFIFAASVTSPSRFELILMGNYLRYQEIAGHLGKRMYPSSSFAQCVWLPRLLGIEAYTEDHDLHHSRVNCNYSKRFILWDKLFGTYERDERIVAKD